MEDAGLPQGVLYDDGKNPTWRQYVGGSGAQSSMIQFFDTVLGIEHRPTGQRSRPETSESEAKPGATPKSRNNFIHDMRQYMPGPHRRFLHAVECVANIRDFVEKHQTNTELCVAYDACLAMPKSLRNKHIQIVSRYIIVKSSESRSISRNRGPTSPDIPSRGTGIASIKYERNGWSDQQEEEPTPKKMRGTGGTALIPFLKEVRDETGEPVIGVGTEVAHKRKENGDAS